MRQLLTGSFCGEGAFGTVYAASWRDKRVAVKRLKLPPSLPYREQLRLTQAHNVQHVDVYATPLKRFG